MVTEETKLKISQALKGRRHSLKPQDMKLWRWSALLSNHYCIDCGVQVFTQKGISRCRKCWVQSRKHIRPFNNPKGGCLNWKGGVSIGENRLSYIRIKALERRIRKFQAGGSFTIVEWEALKMKYRYMCLCCKRFEPEIKLTIDHIIPLIKGGTNDISNIQPLCTSCNCRKQAKSTDFTKNLQNLWIQ